MYRLRVHGYAHKKRCKGTKYFAYMQIFLYFLVETQVGSKTNQVFFGQFGKGTKVLDGLKFYLFAAEVVDGLCLLETQVRVTL